MYPCSCKFEATFFLVAFIIANIYFWFCLYIGAFPLNGPALFVLFILLAQVPVYWYERKRFTNEKTD